MINVLTDAQAGYGFVVSQKTHIEQEVNETVYPDIQYPDLIPVDTSANPFAQTVTYYSSDKFGKAEWINGNSDDIPLAGTERAEHKTSVYTAGIGYGYGWEEVNSAILVGGNLTSDDAMAARRAYEEMVDRVALKGDGDKGFSGLIDNPAVAKKNAATGEWGTATWQNILADVNDALFITNKGTNYTSLANTLLLPPERMNLLGTTFNSDGSRTLMEMLQASNTYTVQTGQRLTVRAVRGLETAGASNKPRMVAYRRDPQVLKMHIPMPHRFLPVYQSGPLNWLVPGVFRLGGLDIRRPGEVTYVDNI